MPEHRLTRTGDAPIRIDGEIVAESDGRRQGDRDRNRWHDITIYRLTDGRYVIAIVYQSQWQGELCHHLADVVKTAADVAATLRDHDPCRAVTGYPAGEQYQERQAALLRDVRGRYEAQVADVLDSDEFAETIGSTL